MFQFLPRKIRTDQAEGTIRCSYTLNEVGCSGTPWGGGAQANGRMDAPVRLTSMNAHYSRSEGVGNRPRTNLGLIERFAEEPDLYDTWTLHCHGSFGSYVENLQKRF